MKKDKDEVDGIISEIQKEYGAESIRRGILSGAMKCDVISTRCVALDIALGVGGFPRGRMIEVFGPEASGKTTLASTVIAEAQSKGGIAAMIDTEHVFDPKYGKDIGVNIEDLLFSQPDTGEQAMDMVEKLIDTNKVDVIVIDSVAALIPRVVLEGTMDDTNVAGVARLMSKALAKIKGKVRKSKTCLIFTNQLRDKVGFSMPGMPTEMTTGGRSLKYYSSIRVEIRRIGSIGATGKDKTGNRIRAKVVKNKVAPPFRIAEFNIIFGKGISTAGSILECAVRAKLVDKQSSYFILGETKLGNGQEAATEFLEKNPEIMAKLDADTRSKLLEAEIPTDMTEDDTN